ncbi:DotH/IcmK family type IV secretion protein [Desulfovibrio sp.]|uniref:DotH/IcmK family type IV secretion protein n=1 Tax=Desulfovibrio sp. TaxID=885 RepID=UPI00345BC160
MRNNRGSIVKRLCLCCLWAVMAVLLMVGSSWADDAQKQPPPPPAAVDNQGAAVLGQPEAQPAPASGAMMQRQEQQPGAANPDAGKTREAQALFEESLRQMMPLDEGQIQEYRERSDQRERALLPVSPALNSRTVRVSLEPGGAPVKVFTTANIATSLVFHDSTGQPWPITSVTNGGPNYFQVLRPDLPDGNLLNVMPTQGYGTSTIVVTLEKRDIPLVIRLESDSVRSPQRKADALVLFQLAHYGPKASVPIIENIKETADSAMLAFLDRVPPVEAARVRMEPGQEKVNVWKYNDRHYIRTSHTLMWPAWTAVVNGAGNVKCYEAPVTARVMFSINGRIQTIILKDSLK